MFARSTASILGALILGALASGCGTSVSTPDNSNKTFSEENVSEINQLPPAGVIGAKVDGVIAQVSRVQPGADGTTLVVYTDAEMVKDQAMVLTDSANFKVDDYVKVSGRVKDFSKAKNAIGTEVVLPRIDATSIASTNASALDPPLQTIRIGQTKTLAGVRISVIRAEITKKQVRIWVRYKNNSSIAYSSIPNLTAEGEQLDPAYSEDFKDPASSVSPGAKTAGVLLFDAAEPQSRFVLTFDGYNRNFKRVKVRFLFGG
jgi:hypothetical protein